MARYRLWGEYFNSIGLPDELVETYDNYVNSFNTAKYPIIFEFNHLAKLLGKTNAYLASVINSPEKHYRNIVIPKKDNRGYREIQAPYPALLECQKWIYENILLNSNVHRAAHGFKKNRSIITNAQQHVSQKRLLKIDLKDFFPSINIRRVIALFRKIGYPNNVSFYLSKICCYENRLPQGGATSPCLSNITTYPMDVRLDKLARKLHLNYSRYADDLTFSGDNISGKLVDYITTIISECGFTVNTSKTLLIKSSRKKIVTGLSVAGDKLKLPKKYKRKLRQELYFILKYGYLSHVSNQKIKNPHYLESIYGKYIFWKSIEPENSFVLNNHDKIIEMIKYFNS